MTDAKHARAVHDTITTLMAERDEARAACAAMRAALAVALAAEDGASRVPGYLVAAAARVAAAADPGRPILDALKQAEEALRVARPHVGLDTLTALHAMDEQPSAMREAEDASRRIRVVDAALAALDGVRR